jgi:AcrR family transcriptional regulator
MLRSVAQRGYGATTVPLVVAEARVSRNAFYALFTDKTDCFIALCDELAEEILDLIGTITDPDDWLATLRTGTENYLRWWAERPEFARAYFLELPSAGPRAMEQRERQYARFRELFELVGRWARSQQPDLPPLSPLASRAIVATVTDLVAAETRAGRATELGDRSDELFALQVLLLSGS